MPERVDGLPFEIQHSLLRVIQEALTNTYRHATASRVVIDLRCGAGILKLRVLDDGCGLSCGVRKAAEGGAVSGGLAGVARATPAAVPGPGPGACPGFVLFVVNRGEEGAG